jgi:hypothetical protein
MGGPLTQFAAYVHEGVWHIWLGFDHILFLVPLLLPAVLARRDGSWNAAASFRDAFWDVARIVTAFFGALDHAHVGGARDRLVAFALGRIGDCTFGRAGRASESIFPVVLRAGAGSRRSRSARCGFGLPALADLGLPAGLLRRYLRAGANVGVELGATRHRGRVPAAGLCTGVHMGLGASCLREGRR